ncbi:MAG TPA: hydrolase [Sphingomonas sp.]|nr:hydrolase [Sphingomonas sp.]
MATYDPRTTALVLIDLQKGIVGMDLAPRSGEDVVKTARELAALFRESDAPVVLVHVDWAKDGGDRPSQEVDQPMPPHETLPPDWSQFVDGLCDEEDLVVLKHHWGAFTGTDLDLRLRRRGIRTIVLGGIATNFGVESTARSGWELGYDIVIVEDACASSDTELHRMAIEKILPRISHVVSAETIELTSKTQVQRLV